MSNNGREQALEKSNFARKCNLLSRYLKQNGGFGGIDLGLTRKPDSLPNGQERSKRKSETSETKTFEFGQKLCGAGHSTSSGGKASDADFSEPEAGTSQMTIFLGGKVLVFDEFPADKAKEIMEMAKLVSPETSSGSEKCKNHIKDDEEKSSVDNVNNNNSSSKSSVVIPDLNAPTSSGDNHQTRQQSQIVERIARRASLHRFFAKRKDRAVAGRGPYQVNQNADRPPKPESASQSLERGQSSGRAINGVAARLLNPDGHRGKPLEEVEEEEEEKEGQCLRDLELRL